MGKAYLTTFSYDCEIAFNSFDGTSMEILKECVKYIVVDHDYNKRIMPVIYIKVALKPSVYNKMVPEQGKSKIYLKLIRNRRKGSTSSIGKKVIYDEFDYYMTDDPNAYKKMDIPTEDNGTAYKICHIGLLKTDLQKSNVRSFEGIFTNTTNMALAQHATSHMKIVMQPFTNNRSIKRFACPPLTTVGQFLAYLNSKYNFYKGSYMYYVDFEKCYLRSNDGSYIDAKDGDLKYIAFDVRDLTSYNALSTGMVEDEEQDAYIIYVQANDAQIIIDRTTPEIASNITSIDSVDIKTTSVSVNTSHITNVQPNSSNIVLVTTNPTLAQHVKTKMAENTDTLIVSKLDMDSRVFTPNKQYLLCNYEDNSKYCGVYYMTQKKELYLRNGEQMNCQMTLTMKKCADFVK